MESDISRWISPSSASLPLPFEVTWRSQLASNFSSKFAALTADSLAARDRISAARGMSRQVLRNVMSTHRLLTPRSSVRNFNSGSERYGRVNFLTPANQRLREFWPRSGVGGRARDVCRWWARESESLASRLDLSKNAQNTAEMQKRRED